MDDLNLNKDIDKKDLEENKTDNLMALVFFDLFHLCAFICMRFFAVDINILGISCS